MPDKEKKALAAALTDLHMGYLAVGGETSVGRGLFSVNSINGEEVTEEIANSGEKMYIRILSEIEEAFR